MPVNSRRISESTLVAVRMTRVEFTSLRSCCQTPCVVVRTQTALAAAGVIPDPTATYTSDTIVSAIQSGLGSEPLVHCEKGMLTEVRQRPLGDPCGVGHPDGVLASCVSPSLQRWIRRQYAFVLLGSKAAGGI